MSAREYDELGEAINRVDFDHVFRVVDGKVVDGARDDHAPSVHHDETDDVEIDAWRGEVWQAFTGMTGQYGYSGAVMHASEYIGGGIAQRIVEHQADYPDAVFAVVVVECYPDDKDDDPEPAGWALVYRNTRPTTG